MPGKKLIVIGGGAAGFFCAVNAARMKRDLQVILLEKTTKLLSKVKVSGGGRCNVTHALFDIEEMSRRYPRGQHFVKKAFHQFFTTDTIQWFEQRRVLLKKEKDGRMFPITDSSQTIIDCLMKEAAQGKVDIRLGTEVKEISVDDHSLFTIHCSNSTVLQADYVCIACGGYPKASSFSWLQQLGHSITTPVPSLFTFNMPQHAITSLMGVSVEKARVKIEGSKLVEEGPLLITHWGLSGPAVLRISAWGARELSGLNYEFTTHINWMPHFNEQSLKEEVGSFKTAYASKKVIGYNFTGLPNRLFQFLAAGSDISEGLRWADLSAKKENLLIKSLVDYIVTVKGKTTFKEEFVTAGGIATNEIAPDTMMSKKIPHVYFAGEIIDVDGITGGFNFQHAWTSGYIAAKAIAATA